MAQDIPEPLDLSDDDADDDDIPSNPHLDATFESILAERFDRRGFLAGIGAAIAASGIGATMVSKFAMAAGNKSSLTFSELPHGYDHEFHVAEGYDHEVLIRWGDPVEPDAPAFDPINQTAAAQRRQFGYNNDFIGFLPLPAGSNSSDRGLLAVNHEYTNAQLMFPGVTKKNYFETMTREFVEVEMAAHGHTVIEVARENGKWNVVAGSRFARRITALETEIEISGPAAGHDRLKTKADPTGRRVIGTFNNCAGGITPWGTVLFAEENFHGYFSGDAAASGEARNHKRYGLNGKPRYAWSKFHDRFNVDKEPNEPNRFGWIVEYDPYDPSATPVKRTALGRFKHEGATAVINKDRRVVVYSGDDQRFDYIYKFISTGRYDPNNREANRNLLDTGTLFAAKFEANGDLQWLPLVWGKDPLQPVNGFNSQADVLIEARRAADLMGATPMDRPEDVETNPATGVVYIMLTNNTKRKPGMENGANPRANNRHGHIVEMIPPGDADGRDHAALTFRWDILLKAGDPDMPADRAMYHAEVTRAGWLSNPDNCAFDSQGRLWIATDGAPRSGLADGVWATDTTGGGRALTRHFLHAPRGAELCGPAFTPDDTTLFVAVQHPADEKGSTFENPSTRWPDFNDNMPVRPSVVAVTHKQGKVIGS